MASGVLEGELLLPAIPGPIVQNDAGSVPDGDLGQGVAGDDVERGFELSCLAHEYGAVETAADEIQRLHPGGGAGQA